MDGEDNFLLPREVGKMSIEGIPQKRFRKPLREFIKKAVKISDAIAEIILYGSVARGEADTRSDVDLFLLLWKPLDGTTESKLFKLAREISNAHFYKKQEWNKINLVLCGPKDISKFDVSTLKAMLGGNRLYSKFESLTMLPLKPAIILHLDLEKVNERAKKRMDAALRGWTSTYVSKGKKIKKRYEGLLRRYRAKRFSRDTYLIPVNNAKIFYDFFSRLGIPFVETKVWLESD